MIEVPQALAVLRDSFARGLASALRSLATCLLVSSLAACVEADVQDADAARVPDGATGKASRDGGADATASSTLGETDAGELSDATAPTPMFAATAPTWAKPLLGAYVLRVRNYSREKSTTVGTSHEIISSALVYYDKTVGEVRLRMQMCQDDGQALGLFKGFVAHPLKYPERLLRVDPELPGQFTTQILVPDSVGFDPVLRADCTMPGQRVNRGDQQAWLSLNGWCECPDPTLRLPNKKEDCRVTDPDEDNRAGITMQTGIGVLYAVSLDLSRIVRGSIDAAKRQHRASHAVNQMTNQIDCPVGGCARPDLFDCPVELNTVELGPLDATTEGPLRPCSEVLEALPRVLPPGTAQFPESECR